MLIKILLVSALLLIVFAVVISLRPTLFRVIRSASFGASPAIVFGHVNDLHKWQAWSPWAKLDPAAKNSFSGPPSGVDASFAWVGNAHVGAGSMTIVESRPDELVRLRLDFLKPFKGTNTAEFVFKPEGDHTVVTWSTSGKNNFLAKAVGLFMNCEELVGRQFEQGLADLKVLAEAETIR